MGGRTTRSLRLSITHTFRSRAGIGVSLFCSQLTVFRTLPIVAPSGVGTLVVVHWCFLAQRELEHLRLLACCFQGAMWLEPRALLACCALVLALVLLVCAVLQCTHRRRVVGLCWNYDAINRALKDKQLPALLLNLNALERNVARYCAIARAANKSLRIATKSIRVPEVVDRVLSIAKEHETTVSGLMCYSAAEARFYVRCARSEGFVLVHSRVCQANRYQGEVDLLIAYPCAATDLRDVLDANVGLQREI